MRRDEVLQAVRQALSAVQDPCSVAAGRPTNIVDLGLLVSADVDDDGVLVIVLRTTFPGCTMAPHFTRAAETCAGQIPGVRSVRVEIDPEFTWRPRPQPSRVPATDVVPWALRGASDRRERDSHT